MNSFQKKLTVFFVFLMAVTSPSNAQTDYRFEKITVEDGLSQSSITSLVQDDFGYLWIGTLDGLNKYDGKHFTVYKHEEAKASSIPSNEIRKLFLDRKKQLWVVGRSSISRYLPEFDAFENTTIAIKNEDFSTTLLYNVVSLSDTSLALCTSKGIVGFSIPKKKFYRMVPLKQFNYQTVKDYLNSPVFGEWVFTQTKTMVRYKGEDSWTTILEDTLAIANHLDLKNKKIYLQTKFNLYQYDLGIKKLTVIDTYDGIDFEPLNFGMLTRSNGALWVYRKEIYVYNPELNKEVTLTHLAQNPFSISGRYLSCMYESQDGVVWVGTNGLGLNKYNPNTAVFNFIGAFHGAPIAVSENYISAIYTSNDDELYVGTTINVDYINRKKSKSQAIELKTPAGKHTRVNKFLLTNDKLWLLTDNGLRYLINNEVFDSNIPELADYSLSFSDYAQLAPQKYALATTRGVYVWDAEKNRAKKISQYATKAIGFFENKLWVEANDSVIVVNPTTGVVVKSFPKSIKGNAGIPPVSVRCFYNDRENNLWIGTWGGGLVQYDSANKKFLVFNEKHGLPDLVVYSILEDEFGNLWIGSNKGLSVFDKQLKKVIRNYTKEDGLQGDEFNTRAAYKSRSGILYFGGVNGLTYFKPSEVLKINQSAPKAVITGFYINHVRMDTTERGIGLKKNQGSTIDLMWDENSFDIELSSLNYTLAGQARYKYWLENYDADWNDMGERSFISFSNLPAGSYLLHIKAYTSKGAIQNDDLLLRINIRQPFWRNIYFYFVILMGTLILITLVYKARTASLRKHSETLAKLVQERTEQLQAMNEEIAAQNEEITAQNEEITAQNEEITLQNETLQEIRSSLEHTVEARTASLKEANAKLAAQNSQLEQYAFITAHNLRGPVARIKGLVNILLGQSVELDYLKAAVKDLDDLIAELNEILDVQFDTDKSKFEPVNLKEILLKVMATFSDQVKQQNATLDTVGFEEPVWMGAKAYFHSIFYNLLSNALKYADPARKLIITFSCLKSADQLRLAVSDTGLGIDMKYTQGKIFTMYQRFHPEIQGKGFGLFLVRSQVEAMGGTIAVESEVGKGTMFTIIFNSREGKS